MSPWGSDLERFGWSISLLIGERFRAPESSKSQGSCDVKKRRYLTSRSLHWLRHMKNITKKDRGDLNPGLNKHPVADQNSNGQMYKYHESHVCMQFCSLCLICLISNSELFGRKEISSYPFKIKNHHPKQKFKNSDTFVVATHWLSFVAGDQKLLLLSSQDGSLLLTQL